MIEVIDELKDDRHEALIDDEKVEWVPDVSPKVHGFVQKLKAEALAFNNPIKMDLVEMYMRTGGTRDGRTADRILEAIKQHRPEVPEEDKVIDMPTRSAENAEDRKEKREKSSTSRFSLK